MKASRFLINIGSTLLLAALAFLVDGTSHAMSLKLEAVPRELLWGDTHVHTRNSADAYTLGNETLSPEDAFLFAKGEALEMQNGSVARLRRPLDFLAVSDHAEYLSVFSGLDDGDSTLAQTEIGERWSKYIREKDRGKMFKEFVELLGQTTGSKIPYGIRGSIWRSVGLTADKFNDPGKFTAFTAYEWTSNKLGNL